MEEVKKVTPETQKLTYEQLEQIAHQLSDRCNKLQKALQEANMTNIFKRIEFLFKVLACGDHFDPAFVSKSAEEIQLLMTIPEEDTKDSKEIPDKSYESQ